MTIEELFIKALNDRTFFDALAKDPESALRQVEATPTQAQITALKKVNYKVLEEIAEAFGPSRSIT